MNEMPKPSMLEQAVTAIKTNNLTRAYSLLVSCTDAEADDSRVWFQLGDALSGMKKWPAAAAAYARCNALAPNNVETITNLGWYLHLSGRSSEALPLLEQAVQMAPERPVGRCNLAQVYLMLGDRKRAIEEAKKAIDLDPMPPVFHMSLAFSLLVDGQMLEGFKEYRARFAHNMPEFLNYPYMQWQGDPVDRLFLQCEQGLGDSIQMMRYIPEAAKRCGMLLFYCQKELLSLFEDHLTLQNIEIHPMPKPLPKADAWCATMSLPVALGINSPGSHSDPYIFSSKKLLHPRKGFHIGITWFGDPKHDLNDHRSIPLLEFIRLAEIPNTTIYSLQFGKASEHIGDLGLHGIIKDLSPNCFGMKATADQIAKLDLVITIDTVTAHLAGAMGVPTWLILNRFGNDWRWGQFEITTPWYPSMRIYRKESREHWSDVMAQICKDIQSEGLNK